MNQRITFLIEGLNIEIANRVNLELPQIGDDLISTYRRKNQAALIEKQDAAISGLMGILSKIDFDFIAEREAEMELLKVLHEQQLAQLANLRDDDETPPSVVLQASKSCCNVQVEMGRVRAEMSRHIDNVVYTR